MHFFFTSLDQNSHVSFCLSPSTSHLKSLGQLASNFDGMMPLLALFTKIIFCVHENQPKWSMLTKYRSKCYKFIKKSSPLKLLSQLEPYFAGMVSTKMPTDQLKKPQELNLILQGPNGISVLSLTPEPV